MEVALKRGGSERDIVSIRMSEAGTPSVSKKGAMDELGWSGRGLETMEGQR
jgi:hypothetical protein